METNPSNIDETRSCLRIAVAIPVRGTFLYTVPQDMERHVQVGCRALVHFKNRNVTGYILESVPQKNPRHLKEIRTILDTEPLFHAKMVSFFEWMADYYLHPIGLVIQSALPGGLNLHSFKTAVLTEKGRQALEELPDPSEERRCLLWVKNHSGKRLPKPVHEFYSLQKKGWLTIEGRTKKRQTGPLMRKFVRPQKEASFGVAVAQNHRPRTARNETQFLQAVFASDATPLSELTAKFTNGSYLAKKWVTKNILEEFTEAVYRNPAGKVLFPSPPPVKLYDQQRQAIDFMKRCLEKKAFCACLLHGVTGSGKTEVYYRAAEHAIRMGRRVILIVPEIALSVYMESVFRPRLGDRMAVYHSGLSQGERYDEWMRMARGAVDLVIGARSALFAPLSKLGLIVVDEEHDSAYKQESNLRYQARDAAVVRAKFENALVVLGSGTPSIQSVQNCANGRYHLIEMPERVEKRPLPQVEIVDMKTVDGGQAGDEILSPPLSKAIGGNLKAGNQTILFLNRRGFHRLLLCRSCGQSIRCPNCEVALTFHLKENHLICHYCGYAAKAALKCGACGCEGLKSYGFGTEKLEHHLLERFPAARIARLDTDSTRQKGKAFQILKRFSDHQIDILVGTQMITKGYDFPDVTLVGVVDADLSLAFPDFRAGERTFQLLSQVSGRAGRGSQRGRVIIQSFNPEHYAVNTAMTHNFQLFLEKERELRCQLGYPPFSHLACLRLRGNSKRKTADAAKRISDGIRTTLQKWPKRGKEIKLLGPVEAPISKLKGKTRWHILLKSSSTSLLHHLLCEIDRFSKKELTSSGVHLIIDVDPYQMI
jgi:primosomal protein N' (replication factor Y)